MGKHKKQKKSKDHDKWVKEKAQERKMEIETPETDLKDFEQILESSDEGGAMVIDEENVAAEKKLKVKGREMKRSTKKALSAKREKARIYSERIEARLLKASKEKRKK